MGSNVCAYALKRETGGGADKQTPDIPFPHLRNASQGLSLKPGLIIPSHRDCSQGSQYLRPGSCMP